MTTLSSLSNAFIKSLNFSAISSTDIATLSSAQVSLLSTLQVGGDNVLKRRSTVRQNQRTCRSEVFYASGCLESCVELVCGYVLIANGDIVYGPPDQRKSSSA